ncbi:hypothetical protein [Phytomonospora endophytica]|uniref:Uncharacterized protein n=1 Tax=Phytomonospora endophytica TaxID=714109 RepID=A0A841FND3_9ACTN|nr:hypothetical protein [Phytomonospora endophytica]MBB6038821.1 hypothetical protein [Phytomonospora endophytica]GIG68383.1 hypothetical protein Pen01_46780 [Phytomonospora endophytica]
MKFFTRLADAALRRVAPEVEAEAACILIQVYSPNCDGWCVWTYDNCANKYGRCPWA